MIVGTDKIRVYQSWSDEWGVYRVYTEQGQLRRFLLITTTRREEACYYGERIAKVLGKPYVGEHFDKIPLPEEPKEASEVGSDANTEQSGEQTASSADQKPVRKKKVMGVGKLIRQMLAEGGSDEEITAELLPQYLAVGRDEQDARWTISVSIDNIRKEQTA